MPVFQVRKTLSTRVVKRTRNDPAPYTRNGTSVKSSLSRGRLLPFFRLGGSLVRMMRLAKINSPKSRKETALWSENELTEVCG